MKPTRDRVLCIAEKQDCARNACGGAEFSLRLFALNEGYFVIDKYAGRLLEQFALRPRDFTPRLAHVLSNPGGNPQESCLGHLNC
jgi:hypothetical protein